MRGCPSHARMPPCLPNSRTLNPKQVVHDGHFTPQEERKDGRTDTPPARNLIEINGQIFGCRPGLEDHRVFARLHDLVGMVIGGKFRK